MKWGMCYAFNDRQVRDRMLGIISHSAPHIAVQSTEGIVELERCRGEMSRVLSIYSLFVHREIFEPLLLNGTASEVTAAKEIKLECICLVEEFCAFNSRWQFADLAFEWKNYQPAAQEFRLCIQR
ncbi:hypothetical protein [Sphingomonas sp. UYP23]